MSAAISVERLTKTYRLGQIGGGTLASDLSRWYARIRRQPDPLAKIGDDHASRQKGEVFWALKDVSFQVQQGDVLGIIGRNGAGKSTLLKILSQVTSPTDGRIAIRGRVASLLEVGTGFHPELTGRENVFLNGAILGMTKAEIRRSFDEIVAFSECEAFIDTPVKRYSSGMYVRLAFAVAAHLEPEILIVDEVLAVGDQQFQNKCLGKMRDVSKTGRTVLFVSHNMMAVQALCSTGLVLGDGRVLDSGPVSHCIDSYLTAGGSTHGLEWHRPITATHPPFYFESVKSTLHGENPEHVLELDVAFRSTQHHAKAFIAIDILDAASTALAQSIPRLEPFIAPAPDGGSMRISVDLPPLVPGMYSVTLWAGSHNTTTFDTIREAVTFEILHSPTAGRTFPHHREHGFIVPRAQVTLHDSAGMTVNS